ncbi:MAG: hypothetical protein ACREOS_12355, partial [Candidatus Dormibacteraceae bacterium]
MPDYIPLDLSRFRDSGLAALKPGRYAPIGNQVLRGLPFAIGADPDRCFLGFGSTLRQAEVEIPIGVAANSVVIAHRLLESGIPDGGPVGELIAEYVFRYQDGDEQRVPIRDRFEISVAPTGWGQLPFRAVPDQSDGLRARYEGRFGDAGYRQTEARQGSPLGYFLWAWTNPRPTVPLDRLIVVPKEHRFLIAGVTLGHLDEHPFVRSGARMVKITLTDPDDARRPFDLSVEVDRGTATFPYALPGGSTEEFIADSFAGFGEAQNQQSSPAYVEIAATPSATIAIKQSDQTVGEAIWGEIEAKKSVKAMGARIELVDPGRNWVRTTVLDADTGQPIPCRIHFRSPEGIPYQPHGHHTHVNGNLETWHVDVGGD